jgi:2-keto-4-pentenoate hydratase/2-oxohepta-3-ene-1,7-dioic acid hydratase in catechol pathway
MDSDVPQEPVVFLKPSTALVRSGRSVVLPPQSKDVQHEVELVVVIGRSGRHIAEEEALDHVDAYALGLDMTARDLQMQAKNKGLPWTVSKGFDTFAPLGPLQAARNIPNPQDLEMELSVNGTTRQEASTSHMVFSVARLISYCSRIFTLEPGDLIYTGTPEGVGPIQDGDRLEARARGLGTLRVRAKREEKSWVA